MHLVLLLPGSEQAVPPHLSQLPSDTCLPLQQGQSSQTARKRQSIPKVCIFQGDSQGNKANALDLIWIIPDPQEEITSV